MRKTQISCTPFNLIRSCGIGMVMTLSIGCHLPKQSFDFPHSVSAADDLNGLFVREKGWSGGDGIFTKRVDYGRRQRKKPTGKVCWWFSDTIIREAASDSMPPGFKMIHNSMAWSNTAQIDSIRFVWDTLDTEDPSMFKLPKHRYPNDQYLWLGDGFISGKKEKRLHIFQYRIWDSLQGVPFAFQEKGNGILSFSLNGIPDPGLHTQTELPFFLGSRVSNGLSFGAAVLDNTRSIGKTKKDGFIYAYAVRGKNKQAFVARFKPEQVSDHHAWRFHTANGWTNDFTAAIPVADSVSNEMSITPLQDGRFLMVFMIQGIGTVIGARVGLSPTGPFGPIIPLFDVRNTLEPGKAIYAYNAKAHPALSGKDELLISYNVNSFDFWNDIQTYPTHYRPRFFRVNFSSMNNNR